MNDGISNLLLAQFSEFVAAHMGLHFPAERWPDLRRGILSAMPEFGYTDETDCVTSLMSAPLTRQQIEILAGHESLVATVRIGQLRLVIDGKIRRAAITEGFARVKPGRVDLFVDAAEWPEEIDRERAESALGRAATRLATEALSWRIEASKRAAARAHNRIAVAQGTPTQPSSATM